MTIHRIYWLTVAFGLIGFVSYFAVLGPIPAIAFLLGAAGSFGNLWLFDWLSRAIAPGTASRKPWQTGTFITRYLLFFAVGYVIVEGLGVSPLPVVLGLLASTAAVLISSIFELAASLFGSRFSR
jgi:hypothetical protein